jgi:hypothetical protein
MKFHTVNTIMNGVLPVEANLGQKVEWHSTLVDLETGEAHREFDCSGVIRNFTHIEMPGLQGKTHVWKYVIFEEAVINGKDVVEAGIPVGFFR